MPSFSNSISLLSMKLTRQNGYLSSAQSVQKHVKTHQKSADHAPSQKHFRYYNIQRQHIRGRECYTMQVRNCNEFSGYRVNVLYIHGGAYVHEMILKQWDFLAAIITAGTAKGLNITITIPIYSLVTPDILDIHEGHGHAHAVLGFLKAAYRRIAEGRGRNRDIVIMGEEAGGGLAYALAVSLDSKSGLPPPRRVILLSPWLDIYLRSPLVQTLQRSDPTHRLEGLREAGRLFAQGTEPSDSILAPLHAKVDKGLLGRIYVWTSDADVCQADCLTLVAHASKQGIEMTKRSKDRSKRYVCMPGLYPGWMLSPWTPEAGNTIGEVVGVIKEAVLPQRSPSMDVDKRRKSSTSRCDKRGEKFGTWDTIHESKNLVTARSLSMGAIRQLSSRSSISRIPRSQPRPHSTADGFSFGFAPRHFSKEDPIAETFSDERRTSSDDEGSRDSWIPDAFPYPARQTNSDDETVRRKPSPPTSYPTAIPFSASLSCHHVFPRSRLNSTTSGPFKSSSVNTPISDTFNFDFETTADVKSPNYGCSTSVGFGEHCGGGHGGTLQPLNGPLILEPLAGSWSME
jgi:epsilon-lactone hydrolase